MSPNEETKSTEVDLRFRRALLLLWRAVRLRCPNCGSGGLWRTWFRMRERCPFPLFFYPFSKTVFLAFDLFFRPPRPEDFA